MSNENDPHEKITWIIAGIVLLIFMVYTFTSSAGWVDSPRDIMDALSG